MFSKLIVAALISVAVAAPQHHTAQQFPAGVDPSKCPGFPICDNALLHGQQPQPSQRSNSWSAPAPSWDERQEEPRSQWEQPRQREWNSQPQQQWNRQPEQQWNQQPRTQWNQQPQQQWNHQQSQPQPEWNQPQRSSAPYQAPSNHLASSNEIFGKGGDKFPAGVNPQSCPNYPYCEGSDNGYDSVPAAAAAAPTQAAPLPGYNERQYPAGVSPHSCPNFPFCN